MSEIKTNCYEEDAFYYSDQGLVAKRIVRVVPPHHREKIMITPVLAEIGQQNGLYIHRDDIEWDEIGANIPDARVSARNGESFWVEHTRVFDDEMHFVNDNLKRSSEMKLRMIGAPKNLVISYHLGTTIKEAVAFCEGWRDWPTVESHVDAYASIMENKKGKSENLGYIVDDKSYEGPIIFMLESDRADAEQIIKAAITSKEKKYGLAASNTVLVLDDETRSLTADEICLAAQKVSTGIESTFRGIYLVSFTGLIGGTSPAWRCEPIKNAEFKRG